MVRIVVMNKVRFLVVVLVLFLSNAIGCTWNEPWQKEILKEAEYFVLGKVVAGEDSVGFSVQIEKSFGSDTLSGEIVIEGCFMAGHSSSADHGSHFNFEEGDYGYFLLKKYGPNSYALPSPTSGFAKVVSDTSVYATYRHSYHQAVIPIEIYERTYIEIWDYYKRGVFDKDSIMTFIEEYMSKPVATFEKEELPVFFLQHAALETAYLLDLELDFFKTMVFVSERNWHSTVSGLQLLGKIKGPNTTELLLDFIGEKKNDNFHIVIAIWALGEIAEKKDIKVLRKLVKKLSDEDTGFGGNIMDPRVGTRFPSPKAAAEKLISTW